MAIAPRTILLVEDNADDEESKEDRDRTSGYYGGANSYVQKPVDFTSFLDAVRQLGMYWLMLNEPPPNRPS